MLNMSISALHCRQYDNLNSHPKGLLNNIIFTNGSGHSHWKLISGNWSAARAVLCFSFLPSMKMYLCLFFAHRMDVAGLLDRSYFTDLGEHSIYFPPPLLILLMFSLLLRRVMHSLIYHCWRERGKMSITTVKCEHLTTVRMLELLL